MIVECVPNISEGRDPVVVSRIALSVQAVEHVALLDKTSDPDHNRSVLTFAGKPHAVGDAAFEGSGAGSHPVNQDVVALTLADLLGA